MAAVVVATNVSAESVTLDTAGLRRALTMSKIHVHKLGGVYVRLQPELQRAIEGGCSCDYCKAHPEQTPKWDTLVIPTHSIPGRGLTHTWTCHWPDMRDNLQPAGAKP